MSITSPRAFALSDLITDVGKGSTLHFWSTVISGTHTFDHNGRKLCIRGSYQRSRGWSIVGSTQAHVDVGDILIPIIVHLSDSSRMNSRKISPIITSTHVFRERRVATAEHEDARILVRKNWTKEVCNLLVFLEPVKRSLPFPSHEYEPGLGPFNVGTRTLRISCP